jgi:DNA-binding protein HU-beta
MINPLSNNLAIRYKVCYLSTGLFFANNIPPNNSKRKIMNKGDLVEIVAQDCNLSKTAAEQVLSSVLGAITNAVATGEKVTLIGFGAFSVSERAAREGRNPKTGGTIQIPAGKVVKFKAGKTLVDAVK